MASIVAALVVLLRSTRPSRRVPSSRAGEKGAGRAVKMCPLCGSALRSGERVRTVVYPASADTVAEVYGCRYCHGPGSSRQRVCPACRAPLGRDAFVVGRMFREGTKNRLHVLGCARCRPKAADYRRGEPPRGTPAP